MSERILAYLRPEPTVWQDDARIWNVEDARKFLDIVRADGLFKRGAKKALESMDAKSELDLGWFLRWLEDPAQFDQIFRCNLSWLRAHALASKSATLEFPLRVAEQRGALTLRQAPKITVGTIHSVKGGEADTVFLFPDLSRPAMQEWLAIGEGRDSIVRQFYVGMTRARETLVLCSPSSPQAITFPRYERKVA
jgi:superfamily I DNA/RNA helicase